MNQIAIIVSLLVFFSAALEAQEPKKSLFPQKTAGARVKPIDETDAAPEVKALYESMTKSGRKLSNITKTMAYRPEIMKAWGPLSRAIMSDTTLDRRLRELVILKVSKLNSCKYCIGAHTLSARAIGIKNEEIDALDQYFQAGFFTDKEKAALAFAEHVTKDASEVPIEVFSRLRNYFDDGQIVSLTSAICLFNYLTKFNEALQVQIDF